MLSNLNISNRQRIILANLEKETYITAQELSNILGVSIRTIKSDIRILRGVIQKIVVIESKPGQGYRVKILVEKEYNALVNSIQEVNIKKMLRFSDDNFNRIIYTIRKLLLAIDYIKIEQLALELYVSTHTIEQDMKNVKKLLMSYNIQVVSENKKGLKIIGTEFDIRRGIAEYFFSYPLPEKSEFTSEKDLLKKLESILREESNKNHILLSEFSIKNISIHLYITIIRFKNNAIIINELKKSINNLSKKAKKTSQNISEVLKKDLNIDLAADEIGYLALHLDSKQIIDDTSKNSLKDEEIINEIIREIKNNFNIDLSKDKQLIQHLRQHIPQMVKRIRLGIINRNPLLQESMKKYIFALKITESVANILEDRYKIKIPLDEFSYLMLYFQNAINKTKKNRKIKVGFVMGRGRADTIVYEQELKDKLPSKEYLILGFSSIDEIKESNVTVDIIVSIYSPYSFKDINMVVIEDKNYIEKIKKYATDIRLKEVDFNKYVKQEYFISNLKGQNKLEVQKNIVDKLRKKNIVTSNMEMDHPFVTKEIGNGIVHIQDLHKICNHPIAFIGILDEPIIWDKTTINIVFLLKTKRDGDKDLPIICQVFSSFFSNPAKVKDLIREKNFIEFKKQLLNINLN